MTLKCLKCDPNGIKIAVFSQTLSNIAQRLKLISSIKSILSNITNKIADKKPEIFFPAWFDLQVSWGHITRWSLKKHKYLCFGSHSGFKFSCANKF